MSKAGTTHRILLVLQTQVNAQSEDLKQALKFLRDRYHLEKLSSVYLAHPRAGRTNLSNGRLSVACTFLIGESAVHVQEAILEYLRVHPRLVEIHLAAYDDQTLLSPGITLPHPELHVRPDWLVPCSEIWADYPHPILSLPLGDIAADADWEGWGQFHAQGATLIDSTK